MRADVEGVSLRDACGRDRARARRSCGRRSRQARSVAAAESDGEALASARAAAAHVGAQRRLLAAPLLRGDRLAAPRDEARRQPVALRAVLHLDPAARRRQDDLPPRPAVAHPRARRELPRGRGDQLQRLGLLGRREREHVVRGGRRSAPADGRAGLRHRLGRHVGRERILLGGAHRHGRCTPEPPRPRPRPLRRWRRTAGQGRRVRRRRRPVGVEPLDVPGNAPALVRGHAVLDRHERVRQRLVAGGLRRHPQLRGSRRAAGDAT